MRDEKDLNKPDSDQPPKGYVDPTEGKDTETGTPEIISPNPKDPAVFKTVHNIKRFKALGQSQETLIAMVLLFENAKDESGARVKTLESTLSTERNQREALQRNCDRLEGYVGSPTLLSAGLFGLLSTALFAAMQIWPQNKGQHIIFGCAVTAGLASFVLTTLTYFMRPKGKQ